MWSRKPIRMCVLGERGGGNEDSEGVMLFWEL